ncbi:nucleoside triphosphate pyrophosphohydrolase family protein [bacterium]|jgi:NTP pyrophosphatase (non-canonical NTP hydrolase)|nr:nucleoside triphosphate pyrophosphohydrolase family protein [bacterium]MBT4649310.1 nucleoside triphosphate pyrophosphohydrolase family protein [bacterium]MBT7553612.1 nucleoside triphosphate pyrophosphohydrolase family protein [bacterium]
MDFKKYQEESQKTVLHKEWDFALPYFVLGLNGEAGEVAEKIKKVLRDNNGVVSDEKKAEIEKELGDVLWYLSQTATELGLDLSEVAAKNLEKLFSRQARNKITGDGDNR